MNRDEKVAQKIDSLTTCSSWKQQIQDRQLGMAACFLDWGNNRERRGIIASGLQLGSSPK